MTRFDYRDRFRASGRTTRLADEYIQKLFDNPGEWVAITDHYPSRRAYELLMMIICRRVAFEHQIVLDSNRYNCSLRIPLDAANRLIELRKCNSNIK